MKTELGHNLKLLERAMTRDVPLLLVSSSYGLSLRHSSEAILGFPLSRNFVIFENGTAYFYRDNYDWFYKLPNKLAVVLKSNQNLTYIQQSIKHTARAIKYLEIFAKNKRKLIPNNIILEELCREISQGIAGMIFAHWIPIYDEMDLAKFSTKHVAYFRSARTKIEKFLSLAAEACYVFTDSLAKKYNIDSPLLKYATHTELHNLLKTGRIDEDDLMKRRKQSFLFLEDKIVSGERGIGKFLNKLNYQLVKPGKISNGKLKGRIAHLGVATGKVQVILSREQFSEFKMGNILVAPMTSPEYTPLIHKASAIITDEGGMLSHAAIVSRELNKPCIVGTKFATNVLKDFQEVLVDADRGIIEIL